MVVAMVLVQLVAPRHIETNLVQNRECRTERRHITIPTAPTNITKSHKSWIQTIVQSAKLSIQKRGWLMVHLLSVAWSTS
jgi:hypothetical protein